MLGVLVTILTVILVFISLLMSLVILMQRPKQEGLGAAFGGALTDRMLGSGTTDFLQRSTVFMGVAFFVLSLTIATLMAYDRNADRLSQLEQVKKAAQAEAAANPDEVAPPPVDGGEAATPPTATLPPAGAATAPPVDAEEAPPVDAEEAPPVDAEEAPSVDAEEAPSVDAEEAPPADVETPADGEESTEEES